MERNGSCVKLRSWCLKTENGGQWPADMSLDYWLTERAKPAVMKNARVQADISKLALCIQGPDEPLPTFIKRFVDHPWVLTLGKTVRRL